MRRFTGYRRVGSFDGRLSSRLIPHISIPARMLDTFRGLAHPHKSLEGKAGSMNRPGRSHPSWTDMSEHVVHMAKGRDSHDAYDNIIGILASRKIEARTPFGIARNLALDPSSQRAVCFSEIPVERLDRLAERRIPGYPDGWHGIGFSKAMVSERGGGPVFYAYAGTPHELAVRDLIRRAQITQAPDDPI